MDQWNTYREQITSEQRFLPSLDLEVMSSLFWQNLSILWVIIFNRLCRGKKKKTFHSLFKEWVLQSFAGFWWDLVVWLKMGRDRQQVSDPDIKQWDVEGWGDTQGGHTQRRSQSHTHTHLHTTYAYTQACSTFTLSYWKPHTFSDTPTHIHRNSPQGSNRDEQRTL